MQAIAGKIIHLLLKDVKKIDVLKEFRSSVTFNQVFSSRFLQLSTPRHWIPQRCPVRDSPVPGDNSQPWRSPKATPQVPELLNVFQKLNSSRSQGHRHKFNMKWRWSEGILKNWDRNGKNKRNMQKKLYFKMLCCQWVETSCNGMIHKLFQQLTLTPGPIHRAFPPKTSVMRLFQIKRGNFSSIFFRRFWRIDVDGVSYVCYV